METQNIEPAPTPIPPSISGEPTPPKPSKMLVVGGLLGLILIAGLGVLVIKQFLPNTPIMPETQTGRPITTEEWQTITSSAESANTVSALKPIIATAEINAPTNPDSLYRQTDEVLNIEPVPIADLASHAAIFNQTKMQFGFKITGYSQNKQGEFEPINLTASYVSLSDNLLNQSQSDVIINGSWGDLVLNESGMDALHVSVINQNQLESLVNIEASDYLMILLDKMVNPDKLRTPGKIEVNPSDIYPYFNHYVKIPQSPLPDTPDLKQIQIDTFAYQSTTFNQTVGQINTYIDQSDQKQLTMGSFGMGLVMVNLDQAKLVEAFNRYWDQLGEYFVIAKASYEAGCPQQDTACLADLGYMSPDEINNMKTLTQAFFTLFSVKKTGLIVDPQSLAYKGISMELEQQDLPINLIEIPFNHIKLSFSFFINQASSEKGVYLPPSVISLDASPSGEIAKATEQGNDLYAVNQAYMRGLKTDIWQALLTESDRYCQKSRDWNPGFCFKSGDWKVYDYDPDNYQKYLYMTYPLGDLDPTKEPYINLSIYPPTSGYDSLCTYELIPGGEKPEFVNYRDVLTAQNIPLRISARESQNENEISGQVCGVKGQNYSTITPFSGTFEFYAYRIPFPDVADQLEKLLNTTTITGEINDQWLSSPKALNPEEYPERKQITHTTNSYKAEADGTEKEVQMLVVGEADPTEKFTCFYSDPYLLQSYGVDPQAIQGGMGFPSGQAVCLNANTCAVCQNGSWDWKTTLDDCLGLRCNP